ncbi:protein TIFY 10A-like isoform X2 [Tripterygium wilfordii]|uniref:protein TIFY 10A-like isoform X2 n=1 Tax=Tripterygium wilfordii TaxID=458696 RepID=UPI0018F7E9F7|nr:protein TIFY 10A-like isoform X2 [Tripterygium wilfordii]
MSTGTERLEFGGQKPEKPSFSQKCSLLSQYLKENGSFGDLSLGMTCNVEENGKPEMLRRAATVLNLFPISEKPGEVLGQNDAKMLKPMSLFPETAGFHGFKEEELPKKADSCVVAGEQVDKTAQMTILYGGQVFVFNDFPADKAKEVMLLAGKESAESCTAFPPPTENKISKTPVEARSLSPNVEPNFGTDLKKDCIQTPTQPTVSVLPITRRASLQRFLEKRKDRITAKAPYQASNPKAGLPKLPVENNLWLGLSPE